MPRLFGTMTLSPLLVLLFARGFVASIEEVDISNDLPRLCESQICENDDETSLLQLQASGVVKPKAILAQANKDDNSHSALSYSMCVAAATAYASINGDVEFHGWTTKCKIPECNVRAVAACVVDHSRILSTPVNDLVESSKLSVGNLKTGSANPLWLGKVLRIRSAIFDGFFVRAIFVLVQAAWSAANKIPFFIDMLETGYDPTHGIGPALPIQGVGEDRFDAYYDPNAKGDRWEQYFKPHSGISKTDVYKTVPEDRIIELSKSTAWFYFVQANFIYPTNFKLAQVHRARRAAEVAAWVRPTDEILSAVAGEWKQGVTSLIQALAVQQQHETLVLGVHMRGTDKFMGGGKVDPSSYWAFIDNFIKFHESGAVKVRVFVASDDMSYLKQALDRYKTRAFRQMGVPRASGSSAIWKEENTTKAHKKGLSVLVDSLMLSRCDFLLKTASAVSEFAVYFNPKLINNSIDLSISDQPLPVWAKGLHNPFLKAD